MAQEKLYELGDKATLFVDTQTKVKITPGKQVAVDAKSRKTDKFKLALRNGHIREYVPKDEDDDSDDDEDDEDDEPTDLDAAGFQALKNNKLKAKYLTDTFELSTEEEADIAKMKTAELHAKFDELTAEDDDEDDAE